MSAATRAAFRRGLRLRRAAWPAALAVLSSVATLAGCLWLRAELDRRDLAAEVAELGLERIDAVNRAQEAECLVRIQGGVIRATELRLTLPPDTLTTIGRP